MGGGSNSWVFSTQGQIQTGNPPETKAFPSAGVCQLRQINKKPSSQNCSRGSETFSPVLHHQKKKEKEKRRTEPMIILLIRSVHLDCSIIPQSAGAAEELVCFFPLKDSLVSGKKIERCQEKFPTSAAPSEVASYASAVDNRLCRR